MCVCHARGTCGRVRRHIARALRTATAAGTGCLVSRVYCERTSSPRIGRGACLSSLHLRACDVTGRLLQHDLAIPDHAPGLPRALHLLGQLHHAHIVLPAILPGASLAGRPAHEPKLDWMYITRKMTMASRHHCLLVRTRECQTRTARTRSGSSQATNPRVGLFVKPTAHHATRNLALQASRGSRLPLAA